MHGANHPARLAFLAQLRLTRAMRSFHSALQELCSEDWTLVWDQIVVRKSVGSALWELFPASAVHLFFGLLEKKPPL